MVKGGGVVFSNYLFTECSVRCVLHRKLKWLRLKHAKFSTENEAYEEIMGGRCLFAWSMIKLRQFQVNVSCLFELGNLFFCSFIVYFGFVSLLYFCVSILDQQLFLLPLFLFILDTTQSDINRARCFWRWYSGCTDVQ